MWRNRLFQSCKPRKTHPQKALQTRPSKNMDKEEYAKRKVRPEHEAKSMVCGEGLPVTSQPASRHMDGWPCPALVSFLKETRWRAVLWAVSHHQSALLPFSDTRFLLRSPTARLPCSQAQMSDSVLADETGTQVAGGASALWLAQGTTPPFGFPQLEQTLLTSSVWTYRQRQQEGCRVTGWKESGSRVTTGGRGPSPPALLSRSLQKCWDGNPCPSGWADNRSEVMEHCLAVKAANDGHTQGWVSMHPLQGTEGGFNLCHSLYL